MRFLSAFNLVTLIIFFTAASAWAGDLSPGNQIKPTLAEGIPEFRVSYWTDGKEAAAIMAFEIPAVQVLDNDNIPASIITIVNSKTQETIAVLPSEHERPILRESALTYSFAFVNRQVVKKLIDSLPHAEIIFSSSSGDLYGYLSISEVCSGHPANVVNTRTGKIGCR